MPGAGDSFLVVEEDRTARHIAQTRQARERNAQLAKSRVKRSLEDFLESLEKGEVQELTLIIKGDVSGSVEALEDALMKIDVGEDVNLRVIHRGVGAITKNDVTLASASQAIILGFNVRPEGKVAEFASTEGVDVRYYSVIYQAIDEIEAALKGMLKPEFEEAQLGTAEVREVFKSSKFGTIAGCLVQSGEVKRNAKARLIRDGAVVADNLSIAGLRRFKDDVTEVRRLRVHQPRSCRTSRWTTSSRRSRCERRSVRPGSPMNASRCSTARRVRRKTWRMLRGNVDWQTGSDTSLLTCSNCESRIRGWVS